MILALAALCAIGACTLLVLARGRAVAPALSRVATYGQATVERPVDRRGPRLPGAEALVAAVWRLAPGRDRARTAAQLRAAGFAGRRVDLFLGLKLGLALGGAVLGWLLGSGRGAAGAVAFAVVLAAIGFVGPDVAVGRRARSRSERMHAELPGALDLLAVIVEAGLGLDAALHRYASHASGPLADEVRLLATELRIADSREEAFARFATRVPFAETKAFARAVTHTDRLGVSLGASLRTLAKDARFRRQSIAEERANKAPVKMLFPTVFCIFPCLLVVVLGPPLLQLVSQL